MLNIYYKVATNSIYLPLVILFSHQATEIKPHWEGTVVNLMVKCHHQTSFKL